jgi:2,4-dienoyl-CoA reductase (NADPH2)
MNEIPGIVDQYRAASVRVRESGYDGIELHAAHGYMLLGSFLSATRNRRTDAYAGGSEEGRIRLLVEVVRAIKSAAGADFPITLRISGYERTPGGRPIYDTARIAPRLVDAGVDAFHVSGGVIDPLTTQMVTGSKFGPAHNVTAARAVRQAVDVPVMAVGRIHDPVLAETILEKGSADLIVMGRPLLADPELPNKARSGRSREIRRCISCENCIDSMEAGRMTCAVNPFTGRESELDLEPASEPRTIAVVGGGPAGLEAARIARIRGHRVTLYERGAMLGGSLLLAATVHPDNQAFLDFLIDETRRVGVDVRLNVELDADEVAALGVDAVLIATGGRLSTPRIPGDELPHVLSGALLRQLLSGKGSAELAGKLAGWQIWGSRLLGPRLARFAHPAWLRRLTRIWMPIGRRVVVLGGDLAAIELAEFLAERGRRVCVVEQGDEIAPEVGSKRRTEHMDRLDLLGVSVHVGLETERILEAEVVFMNGMSIAADSVIMAGQVEAETRLLDALEGRVPEVYALGDSTGLGLIRKATEDAARVACAL